MNVKVTNADGTALAKDTEIACINLLLHAMFRDIVMKVNDTVISQGTGSYPFRAYIETNYTFSAAAKRSAVGIPNYTIKKQQGSFSLLIPKLIRVMANGRAKYLRVKLYECRVVCTVTY